MSLRHYKNYYDGLPETKVLLYHSIKLDPIPLNNFGMLSSLVKTSEHVLITDSNVAKLYLVQLIECLEGLHIHAHPIIVTAGEQTKTLQTYTNLVGHCAGFGLDKESTVISFGGGVVKDLAGFLASTFFRGLNLVHIPTTVLAQVDAAIDWKQAINLPQGKNLIGSMYSPSEIWVNAAFLQTLDERWIRDGLGESVKLALCRSPAFLDLLTQAALSDYGWTSRVVDASVSLKIENLNRESQSEEAVKQYGHAVGHAVEHLSSGSLGHGESIAIGMCVSAELASLAGLTDTITVQKHYDVFEKLELPTRLPEDQHPSRVWAQIHFDKHFLKGEMYAPVLKCVGTLVENEEGQFMIPFSQDIVLQALEQNKTRSVATMYNSKI